MKKEKNSMNWYRLRQRFSLRKYHFGVASVVLGASIILGTSVTVQANTQTAPVAEARAEAGNVVTVDNSSDFVREWNQAGDKTIDLNATGYKNAVTEGMVQNSTLNNTAITTVQGNNQDLTLRGVSIDNQKDLTIKNTKINIVADTGLANPSITSSGNLTLDGVTTSGTVKPDLKVTSGTATVTNGTSETKFNHVTVSDGATLTLEGKQIDAKLVKATDNAKVISDSTGVDEYQGGDLTLKNLVGEVKTTEVKKLSLAGNSNVTLQAGSTITDKLEVPAGTILNIGDNQLTVKELLGTGKIIMSPAGTLNIGTLKEAINVEIKNNTANWAPNDKKAYVVVTTPEATPVVTGSPTPAGEIIVQDGNSWKLEEEKGIDITELENLVNEAYDSIAISEKLKTASPELVDRYNEVFEKADEVLNTATSQSEINAALEALKQTIIELGVYKEEPIVTIKEIPFNIIYKADATSANPAGTKSVETVGQLGEEEITTVDGKEISRRTITPKVNEVVLVSVKPTEVRSTINFNRIYEKDDNLEAGRLVTVTSGIKGVKRTITKYSVDEKTGDLIALAPEEVITPARTERIKVGTKPTEERKEVAYETIEITDPELPKGERRVDVTGQVGVELTVTTYDINPQTGELIENPATTKLEKAPLPEKVRIGSKEVVAEPTVEVSKGSGLTQDAKPYLEVPVITSKGRGLVQDEKPELEVPEITSKGPGLTQDAKPELEVPGITSKGPGLTQDAKPELEVPGITSKGPGLTQDAKPELEVPAITSKGSGLTQDVKPELEVPAITSKGSSLTQDAKPELEVPAITSKGSGLTQDVKPELEIPAITSKGSKLTQAPKAEAPLSESTETSNVTTMALATQSKAISTSQKVAQKQTKAVLPKTGEEEQNYFMLLGGLFTTLAMAGIWISDKRQNMND
ncbi:G5 domain-containing protein [Streptococcus hillyeri]|uniref:YSIRK-type signal peptide-containing protein n=1 Tax=Streptococcus hillyeri TaxID=2282420 RepID=A0A3L9DQS6_9STRE|nr:G5 domain-containing protein [Streptococcus hillyeri]RLY02323.1 YSIRK-type signal peptide-containing protein [Streptococcus hillyeri]